jgi:hypothetical protein
MRFSLKLAQSAQPGERNSKISTKSPKFRSRGHFFLEKTPPMGISSQNTLLNNFSPVQPILTCNTPIDSAQLAETQWEHQKFSKFHFRGATGEFP